jgi:hypothetical protein
MNVTLTLNPGYSPERTARAIAAGVDAGLVHH